MRSYSCAGEELEVALREGRWPLACDPRLRAHVDVCRDCQDLVLVTEAVQEARLQTERVAPVGSPGSLWWRAQRRRRNEAIECMTKPLALAEKLGLLGMLVAFCVAVWQWGPLADWLNFFQDFSGSSGFRLNGLWAALSGASAWFAVVLFATLGTLGFIAGFAVYLLREET